MRRIKATVVVFESTLSEDGFFGSRVIHLLDEDEFMQFCDVVIANRYADELVDIEENLYTRDRHRQDWVFPRDSKSVLKEN